MHASASGRVTTERRTTVTIAIDKLNAMGQ
jgi:hypothetical protein